MVKTTEETRKRKVPEMQRQSCSSSEALLWSTAAGNVDTSKSDPTDVKAGDDKKNAIDVEAAILDSPPRSSSTGEHKKQPEGGAAPAGPVKERWTYGVCHDYGLGAVSDPLTPTVQRLNDYLPHHISLKSGSKCIDLLIDCIVLIVDQNACGTLGTRNTRAYLQKV